MNKPASKPQKRANDGPIISAALGDDAGSGLRWAWPHILAEEQADALPLGGNLEK